MDVTMKCPNCETEFRYPLEDARPGSTHTCASCGEKIGFKGEDGGKFVKAWESLKQAQ